MVSMRRFFLISFVLLTCASCVRDEERLAHVLMVYMGAENNELSSEAYQKIDALRQGSTTVGYKIIVYVDGIGAGPRLIALENGQQSTLAEYEAENSADAAVFTRVTRDIAARYPADSYGLLLFSHASGWLPEGVFSSTRSIMMDNNREMELVDFAAAIPDRFFKYIMFEACFTAGIEMMYELRHKADYIMGSSAEIVSPGYMPFYKTALPCPNCMPNSLVDFADRYFTDVNQASGDRRSATISLIETAGLEALALSVRQAYSDYPHNTLADISAIQYFDRITKPAYPAHYFFDLGDYMEQRYPEVAAAILEKIDACVLYKAATPAFLMPTPAYNGFLISKHCGLTIYIPQNEHAGFNGAYTKLAWYKAVMNE